MNIIFFLPFVAYGLILMVRTGDWFLILLSLSSLLVWWFASQREVIDLEQEISFADGRVWLGRQRLGLFPAMWGSALRNRVYSAAFEESPLTQIDTEAVFRNQIGVTDKAEPVYQPLSPRFPHAIVIGPTAAGKTELLKLISSQYEAEMWVIDFSGGAGFNQFPGVSLMVTDHDSGPLDLMFERLLERELKPANTRLLLVVESLCEALNEPRVAALVGKVASRGRALNVMLLASNQSLGRLPRELLNNFANRISIRADPIDRSQLGFEVKDQASIGDFHLAELLQGSRQVGFGFPVGLSQERTASESSEAANPLLFRVSTKPQ